MSELSDYRASKLKQKAEECLATVCLEPDELLSLLAAREREKGLRQALFNLVKINESWNDAVQATIGRPPGWCDEYLNEARQALAGDSQ